MLVTETGGEKTEIVYETFFKVGMWWRIIYGVFRIIIGVILLQHIDTPLSDLFFTLMRHEVAQDQADFFVNTVGSFLSHQTLTITYFAVIYLVVWGVVDIFFSVALLHHKAWAFSFSIYLIIGFIFYEIFRFTQTHSYMLIALIFVDLFVLYLIMRESTHYKKTHGALLV